MKMPLIRSIKTLTLLSSALLLACSDNTAEAPVPQVQLTELQDAAYEASCKVCHGAPNTGAPQTGVSSDWTDRLERGMDDILKNATDGYNGMPAMGGCFHCSGDDLKAITLYMIGAG